jgi:hypothetical protein
LKVMRDGRSVTVEVTADGAGLVSHAGSALLAQAADKLGLTKALSPRLAAIKQRCRGHDPGRVIRPRGRYGGLLRHRARRLRLPRPAPPARSGEIE